MRALAREPILLILTKANSRSTVHRPAYLDYVGVKRFDAAGKVIGERRFLGLYTYTAYNASPCEIPVLRRKVAAVLDARRASRPAATTTRSWSRSSRPTRATSCSRSTEDELFDIAMGILHLGERQRVRLFVRRDAFGRFVSCLVFLPRDRFNTENRRRIERDPAATRSAATSIDYTTRVSESVLGALHFIVCTEPGAVRATTTSREIEARLVAATRAWTDDLARRADRASTARSAASTLLRALRRRVPGGLPRRLLGRAQRCADIERIEQLDRRRRPRR